MSFSEAMRRAYLNVVRGVVETVSDGSKLQTCNVRLTQDELLTAVERFQQYGHISVPLPSSDRGAEAIVVFVNGNRSHPIVISVDDRRWRPTGGNPGDVGQYHYKGATAWFTDTGYAFNAGAAKLPHSVTVGNSKFTIADGQITANVNGTEIVVTDGKICFGGANASDPVMLQSGASSLLFSTK